MESPTSQMVRPRRASAASAPASPPPRAPPCAAPCVFESCRASQNRCECVNGESASGHQAIYALHNTDASELLWSQKDRTAHSQINWGASSPLSHASCHTVLYCAHHICHAKCHGCPHCMRQCLQGWLTVFRLDQALQACRESNEAAGHVRLPQEGDCTCTASHAPRAPGCPARPEHPKDGVLLTPWCWQINIASLYWQECIASTTFAAHPSLVSSEQA